MISLPPIAADSKLILAISAELTQESAVSSSVSGLPQMMWSRSQHDTAMMREMQDFELNEAFVSLLPPQKSDGIVINGHTAITDYRELGINTDIRQLVSVGRQDRLCYIIK